MLHFLETAFSVGQVSGPQRPSLNFGSNKSSQPESIHPSLPPLPSDPFDCCWSSADPPLSLEEKISSLEKILHRDLKLMKHRQVIHPVLQEGRSLCGPPGLLTTVSDKTSWVQVQSKGGKVQVQTLSRTPAGLWVWEKTGQDRSERGWLRLAGLAVTRDNPNQEPFYFDQKRG